MTLATTHAAGVKLSFSGLMGLDSVTIAARRGTESARGFRPRAIAWRKWCALGAQILGWVLLCAAATVNAQVVLPMPIGVFNLGGQVSATAIQADGKIVIGGAFIAVNGVPRQNIARLNADGSLDMSWNPGMDGGAYDGIHALAVSGNTVYAGGNFTNIGGQPRADIAAIDGTTGQATAWNPGADGTTDALVVSGSIVYAAGSFSTIGRQPRNNIAAIDATTGQATTWNPNADNQVNALVLSGNVVYAGGYFNNIGGQPHRDIAAIDIATGQATTWNPSADNSISVLVLTGNTVYAGGDFSNIGGQPRVALAAIDATTGLATAWNPNLGVNSGSPAISTVTVSGSTVFVGGHFTSIGGQPRADLAAVDATTGLATAWNPGADSNVTTLAISGGAVYAGGYFSHIGGQPTGGLARIDAASGVPTATPQIFIPGSIAIVLAQADGKILVGGNFIEVNNVTRHNIARFNADGSVDMSWDPVSDGSVAALTIAGSTVYVGGGFATIGGQARANIAAIDATSGQATDWNPGANHQVKVLATSGANVYAGGDFDFIGAQPRNNLAAIDAITGQATTWNPDVRSGVSALAISGNTIYAGGDFTSIGGNTRLGIAAIDATTGLATAWNPGGYVGSVFVAALVVSGNTVYAGGYFSNIGGQTRLNIAAIDATTGQATAWNPGADGEVGNFSGVDALVVSGSIIYAGGNFTYAGNQARVGIAAIDATTGLATAWNPKADNGVTTLTPSGGAVYAGGSFSNIGGEPRIGIAALISADDIFQDGFELLP